MGTIILVILAFVAGFVVGAGRDKVKEVWGKIWRKSSSQ